MFGSISKLTTKYIQTYGNAQANIRLHLRGELSEEPTVFTNYTYNSL